MTTFAAVGDVIAGKYRVDKILAIGGMGMIVAATHLELGQRVALKFMLPEGLTSPTAMARFLREAQAAVRLRSEHVCRVHDVGRFDNGAPYIVMELMDGMDLSKLIKQRGPLPVEEAVDLVLQALEGVAEAHARGIIHRDLKPGNLFVTVDGDDRPFVKVLDFGISKSAFGESATQTGDVMGSPAYMSPEQMASSKNVDVRADIYAIGVILYYAVSRRLPFQADTLPTLCMRVMNEAPRPIEQVRADLPDGFADVIMRCLEKSPAARFADVEELAGALAPFATHDVSTIVRRIARVLHRVPTAPAIPIPHTPPESHALTQQPPTVAMLPSDIEDTTFRSGAAEVSIKITPAPTEFRRKRKAVALGLLGLAAITATIVVMVSIAPRDSSVETSVPAKVPRASAPVAAPEAPPPITPPSPPPAPVHEVAPPAPAATPKITHRRAPTTVVEAKPVEPKPVETKPVEEPKPIEPKSAEPKPTSKWTKMQHDGKQSP